MNGRGRMEKMLDFYGLQADTITAVDIVAIVRQWQEAVVGLDKMVYEDAKKEFSLTSMTGFGADGSSEEKMRDFEEVRGVFESNPFVTAVLEHIKVKSGAWKRTDRTCKEFIVKWEVLRMERICRYICLLCVCFMALQVQANRRKVMECPGFVLSNTAEIEFKRIIQTSEQTQVDAVMYGKPGTPVVISSKAALKWADGGMAQLREAERISIDGVTEPEVIEENGTLEVTLSFSPVPSDVHEVDLSSRRWDGTSLVSS